tara:strand:+ start:325 stop:1188 length:864 start_codon:yes stop_codon:yes gene_type:complete
METNSLIKKVRKIEIKTRKLSNNIFSGEYNSHFKGRGMIFSEVRKYNFGDDIRDIDWNVTAKLNSPYIKVFEEERELTLFLLIDVSRSGVYGTKIQEKKSLITEISAILSFSAIQNNDKVGVIFFSDIVEMYIPPKKGKKHILRIIRELIEIKPKSYKTNLSGALKFFISVIKKRSIAFILSDFQDNGYLNNLKIASKKHDINAIRVFDPSEKDIYNLGLIQIKNPETHKSIFVDTSSKILRNKYKNEYLNFVENFKLNCKLSGTDFIEMSVNENYIPILLNFFKKR